MRNLTKLVCSACLLTLAVVAHADWIADSNRNAMVVLEATGAFYPETMAFYGLDQFDGDITDMRAGVFERQQEVYRGLLKDMQGRLGKSSDARVRQDLQILIQSLEESISSNEIDRTHMLPYYNLHKRLYNSFSLLLAPDNDKARYPAALQRLRKYTGQGEGMQPITDLAMARTSERFAQPGLIGPYVVELQTDLDNAPRFIAGMQSVFEASGLTGWEADLSLLEQQLAGYRNWLESKMKPRARQSNRLPAPVYANNLKQYGVLAAPAELIAQAQYSYQLIRTEMTSLARVIAKQRNWQQSDLVSVLRAFKREQIAADQVLPLYLQRLQEIEDIIRREDLITLPTRDAVIRLATEAEAAAVPASFMRPPQLINNTGQYGEFVLVQANPGMGDEAVMDDWSHNAISWSLTAHEARPGHELQFASLVENGTSLARAIFANNSANTEGWGLYAESIMQQYVPLEGQLFVQYMRLIRAARMFLDPMVNTGMMTPEQVVDFYVEQLALSRPMASSEADRYAFWAPGQATSYYYGFMNMMRLRSKVEVALGDAFNARQFHDFVLEQGLLPPAVLEQAVLAEFVR